MFIRPIKFACLAVLTAAWCAAGTVAFTTLPQDGVLSFTPQQTVGWGYSIQNTTPDYALAIGLANSGVLYGALVDIFDYPVIDPGTTVFQDYSYNAPGGFGSSLGLFEYSAPSDVPVGLHQTGTFTVTFQLYDANPDLDIEAAPIGSPLDVIVGFDLASTDAAPVPEPGSMALMSVGLTLLALFTSRCWRGKVRRLLCKVLA